MKIIMVTEALGGGVLTYLRDVCSYLVSQNHQVLLVYSRGGNTPDEEEIRKSFVGISLLPISFFRNSRLSYVKFWIELRSVVERERPDILHLHSSFAGFIGRLLPSRTYQNTCVYYTPHGYAFLQKGNVLRSWLYLNLERFAAWIRGSVTIVPISKSEEHASYAVSKHTNVHSVFSGVDSNRLTNLKGVVGRSTREKFQVVSCGRLCRQKNPHLFVDIAKICKERRMDVSFLWIGGGELEEEVLRHISEAGLQEEVRVTGWMDYGSVINTLSTSADLYIQTSLWEGMPLTVLEAMFLELCVIVNDVPGNVDPIENGNSGFIASSAEELVLLIEQLFTNNELRISVGQEAKKVVEMSYDIHRNSSKLLTKYLDDFGTIRRAEGLI